MSKCEHGLTSKECYVCASPKYGAPRCPDCGGSGFVYVGSGRLPPAKCRCAARAAPAAPPPSERVLMCRLGGNGPWFVIHPTPADPSDLHRAPNIEYRWFTPGEEA